MKNEKIVNSLFIRMHPLFRVLVAVTAAFIAFLVTKNIGMPFNLFFILLWDVFALVYLISAWIVLFNCPASRIRERAVSEDGSRVFVFFFIVLASFVSMYMVTMLILSKDAAAENIYVPAIIAGMLLSWALVHTTFCVHYAHIYYNDNEDGKPGRAGGLNFPEEKTPDYLDFAYFSFVIGMTFQVSDVEITDRKLRRLALLHGLISFILNTFVVALTINLIAGLKK